MHNTYSHSHEEASESLNTEKSWNTTSSHTSHSWEYTHKFGELFRSELHDMMGYLQVKIRLYQSIDIEKADILQKAYIQIEKISQNLDRALSITDTTSWEFWGALLSVFSPRMALNAAFAKCTPQDIDPNYLRRFNASLDEFRTQAHNLLQQEQNSTPHSQESSVNTEDIPTNTKSDVNTKTISKEDSEVIQTLSDREKEAILLDIHIAVTYLIQKKVSTSPVYVYWESAPISLRQLSREIQTVQKQPFEYYYQAAMQLFSQVMRDTPLPVTDLVKNNINADFLSTYRHRTLSKNSQSPWLSQGNKINRYLEKARIHSSILSYSRIFSDMSSAFELKVDGYHQKTLKNADLAFRIFHSPKLTRFRTIIRENKHIATKDWYFKNITDDNISQFENNIRLLAQLPPYEFSNEKQHYIDACNHILALAKDYIK